MNEAKYQLIHPNNINMQLARIISVHKVQYYAFVCEVSSTRKSLLHFMQKQYFILRPDQCVWRIIAQVIVSYYSEILSMDGKIGNNIKRAHFFLTFFNELQFTHYTDMTYGTLIWMMSEE